MQALSATIALLPAPPPRAFDSRVEQQFARDVLRLAPDWDLVREPAALPAGGALLFPDFALGPHLQRDGSGFEPNDARVDAAGVRPAPDGLRPGPAARVLVEIVGFWTPAYLAKKLERLRAARVGRLILCVDEALRCGAGELPADARVVTFRRAIDAGAVLAVARALLGSVPP